MRNPFFKKAFSGIFAHFLTRNSAIQVFSSILLLMLMLPFFLHMMYKMKVEQGSTIANTTLSATYDALKDNNNLSVARYTQSLIKDTPSIRYVVYSQSSGEEVTVTANGWSSDIRATGYHLLKFSNPEQAIIDANNASSPPSVSPAYQDNIFTYSKPIYLNGAYWGVLTVAFTDQVYVGLLKQFYWTVGLFIFGTFVIGLFLFFVSSKRIRMQIRTFERTAKKLSRGQLSARAPEDSIGEIGTLGKAINRMSSNLEEQSTRLFQLAQIVEQTNDAFILFDTSLKVVFANDAVKDITGYDQSEFASAPLKTLTSTLDINLLDIQNELVQMHENLANSFTKDILIKRKDGHRINVEMRLESIVDEETERQSYLLVFSNITSRKEMEKALHELAFYDKLTGLPNRRKFLDYLQNIIKQAERQNNSFALFFMDLDNFKNINDSMGHEAGDQLLIQIAQKLKEIFRGSDLVTRLGGDEFTVIIEQIKMPDAIDIGHIAEKAVKQLSAQPILINGQALTISTSLGIATFPENGFDADTLVKNADTAMYAAKKSGKNNYAFYTDEMNITLRKFIEIENDLKEAIVAKDQIFLHYQPIVSLQDKALAGVEVLARWNHPIKGEISPTDFINVAEKTDLILTLSASLLRQAFKQAKAWQARGLSHYVSVNISVRQFEKDDFIPFLTALVIDFEVDPNLIQLEFTESIMIDSNEETLTKFANIKELGFRIAIDDFGTGYSSLSYIHKLPIDVIKIDQAFISDMVNNEKSQAILKAITSLSTALDIETVAEGVEDSQHEALLKKCHCYYGQGYLYDASMLIKDFEDKYTPLFDDELLMLVAG